VGVLRDIARIAGDRGVTIGLEPLDIKRTNYRPTATSVREIVELVNDDHLKLMVDTGHLWENGENILEILKRFGGECSEIHLKDSGSRAPGCGDIDFKPIIDACIELKGLKCLEYRPSGDPRRDLEEALRTIRKS
jgi:D-psicose/D-tagatose/L-ribulose 3-epimerase